VVERKSKVATWFELCCVIEGKDGIAQRGSEITASLATFDDDFGNLTEGFHHVF
jgi:hypothetical protein